MIRPGGVFFTRMALPRLPSLLVWSYPKWEEGDGAHSHQWYEMAQAQSFANSVLTIL